MALTRPGWWWLARLADRPALPPLESPVRSVRRGVPTEGVWLQARSPELPAGCGMAGAAGWAAASPGPTEAARDQWLPLVPAHDR